MVTFPPGTPLHELLRAATAAGVAFRLAGSRIGVTGPPDPTLRPLLDALRVRRDEVWEALGGAAQDLPSLRLLDQLGVAVVVPDSVEAARQLIAEMETDADRHGGGELGCDIETAANPGEETRPEVRLRLKDGLPTADQPSLKGGASLDSNRARIRLVQLYGGGDRCLVLDTDAVPLETVADVLRRRVLLIHNSAFELNFFAQAGIEVARFECTMQAAGLLLGAHRRSLGDAAAAYLGLDVPKELQTSDWGAPQLSPGQIAYAALDAILACRLWPKLRTELYNKGRELAYELQRDVTPPTVRMSRRGIGFDRVAHQQEMARWQREADAACQAFVTDTGAAPPTTPRETRAFLTRILPAEIIEDWPTTDKSRELSIKAAELSRHVDIPAIRALLSIAAMTKLQSNFGTRLADKVSRGTGRIHPGYNIAAAKTGRFSSSNPNIQQIPKNKAKGLRGCFVAGPGKVLIKADYNAMELRGGASVSNDATMLADFANNIDPHRRQAAEVLGIPQSEVTAAQRNAAKPINFGTIYGAGGRGLAQMAWINYGIVKSPEEAETERRALLTRYAGLAEWMDVNFIQSNDRGYIRIGRLGRVIEAAWEKPQRSRGFYGHDDDADADDVDDDTDPYAGFFRPIRLKRTLCCNAPIQGACADAAMRALILVDAALTASGIDGGLVLFMHDELVAEAVESDAERAQAILIDGMTRAFIEAFPGAPTNGLVETEIVRSWGPHDDEG